MPKPTQFGTVAGMTGFIGVLPLLLTFGIAQQFPQLNAILLTVIHVCLMVTGVWLFALWFGD
jgi:hypothetical protein